MGDTPTEQTDQVREDVATGQERGRRDAQHARQAAEAHVEPNGSYQHDPLADGGTRTGAYRP